MGRRVLLTGASGFIGGHLLPLLQAAQSKVGEIILASRAPEGEFEGVEHLAVDLVDPAACQKIVAQTAPDTVIHLAGAASVGGTAGAEFSVWQNNVLATMNLAAAVSERPQSTRFIFASSAEVYGRAFNLCERVDETAIPDPASTYGRTKLAAEFLLRDILGARHEVVALRLFNSLGPRQDERFVSGAFAAQIARMESGLVEPVLHVGNLNTLRDFVDVRDTARAIYFVATRETPWPTGVTIMNVSSGRPRSIEDLIAALARFASVKFEVQVDQDRLRPSDVPRAAGDPTLLRTQAGWDPSIDWDSTIRDALDWWRTQLASRA